MWKERAAILKFDDSNSWTKVAEIINKEFNLQLKRETIRGRLRSHPKYKQNDEVMATTINNDGLLEILKKERSIDELTEKFNVSKKILLAYIEDLKDKSYQIVEVNNKIKLFTSVIPSENRYVKNWNGESVFRFGVTSDNHLCSKYSQVSFLHHLYDVFESEGITEVYNPGDLFEGYYKNRPEHIFELIPGCIGADEQIKYVVNNYPKRKNIITRIIAGNHCQTHLKNGGSNVCEALARQREDIEYLGAYNAIVELTPNCKMELNHPGDGSSYATSYSIQKYCDSMSGGDKPNILLNAHHHKLLYLMYRNIHCFETGTTEAQTGFMKGKRIAAHMGGWIIEVNVDKEGTITRLKSEIIPCYTTLKEDWGIYK